MVAVVALVGTTTLAVTTMVYEECTPFIIILVISSIVHFPSPWCIRNPFVERRRRKRSRATGWESGTWHRRVGSLDESR